MKEQKALPIETALEYIDEQTDKKRSNGIRERLFGIKKEKFPGFNIKRLQRAFLLQQLEKFDLLDDFIDKYWKHGKTEDGIKKEKYKSDYGQKHKRFNKLVVKRHKIHPLHLSLTSGIIWRKI